MPSQAFVTAANPIESEFFCVRVFAQRADRACADHFERRIDSYLTGGVFEIAGSPIVLSDFLFENRFVEVEEFKKFEPVSITQFEFALNLSV